jgi:hypothetical protein
MIVTRKDVFDPLAQKLSERILRVTIPEREHWCVTVDDSSQILALVSSLISARCWASMSKKAEYWNSIASFAGQFEV